MVWTILVWMLQKAPRNLSQLGWLGYLGWEVRKPVVFLRASYLSGLSHAQEKFEIFNLGLKTGHSLKIKGKIFDDTDNFSINLGCSSSDLAFHFNPRFNESVIVCNSKCSNAWQAEHRDGHLCFSRGSSIKIVIEMLEDKFQVKLPDGHEVKFPNRHCYSKISYMSVKGGFRVTSFKLD